MRGQHGTPRANGQVTMSVLAVPDQKEELSRVYVTALAARAGYVTSVPGPDRDSVDLRVMAGGPRRPALDLQLKATANLAAAEGGFLRFRLPAKNYNDLRVETQTPRLLVLLELPEDESQWLTVTDEALSLRRRAYWLSLQEGDGAPTDQQSVTVRIPDRNVLSVDALRTLMEQSRRGDI